jgi:hypothetical protein
MVPGGYWGGRIDSELTMNSQCTHWVNAPSPPVSTVVLNPKELERFPGSGGVQVQVVVRIKVDALGGAKVGYYSLTTRAILILLSNRVSA